MSCASYNDYDTAAVWSDHAGGIVYDAELFSKHNLAVGHALFMPEFWLGRQAAHALAGGRGQVYFINHGEAHWVLRHYKRGGLIAKLIADRYVWQGAEATRCFREWRLLTQLHAQGLPVPKAIAARYLRSGWSYRADLITEAIPQARTLTELSTSSVLAASVWQQLGITLARFHAAGVRHADLNAHNIVFDNSQQIFLLDFDRGRICTGDAGWINAVLQRLLRSLNKLKAQRRLNFQPADWQLLLQAHNTHLVQLGLKLRE
jgi:3-deoxy-D-manno-octulosonic acid kinase